MNKTILLDKAENRMLLIFVGTLLTGKTVFGLFTGFDVSLGLLFEIISGVFGLILIFYAQVGLSETSQFSAKIRISDKSIELKRSFWRSPMTMPWVDVKEIYIKKNRVEFSLINGKVSFPYNTKARYSSELNKALLSSGASKGVLVAM